MTMQYVFTKKDALLFELENPSRTAFLWLDRKRGAKNMSSGTAEVPINSELPYHTHKVEELMFIYKGTGVAVIDRETFPLAPETMVFIPPGVKHQFKNTGSEPLAFAFFYAPPGPEQALYNMVKK
jgi:mannose-6-phosphate isomerase-like protein (cupin superfamily)